MEKPVRAISTPDPRGKAADDLASEYRFEYSEAKPNRFSGRRSGVEPVVVLLAPDVAKVFKDSEAVNAMLRSILKALPQDDTRPPARQINNSK
jgi:hypothetical protein